MAPVQASYSPIQRPLTAPYRSPIQKRSISHRTMSQVSKWSAWWDEPNGTKISPIQLPCMAPIQAPYGPIQNPLTASYGPIQGRTNGHTEARPSIKMISMTRQVQWYQNQPCMTALYGPHSSPLWPHSKSPSSLLWPHSKEITSPYNITRYTKMFISTSREKMHPSRPSEHSQQASEPKIITQKEQIKELYADVFEGIGHFPGKPYHINLDQSVTPVQTQCRPVPVHWKEVFKHEINKMLNAGILKPVEKATPWINSFVLVKGKYPDGSIKLRICLDPTNLNKAEWFVNLTAARLLRTLHHLLVNAKVITVTGLFQRILAWRVRWRFILPNYFQYWVLDTSDSPECHLEWM